MSAAADDEVGKVTNLRDRRERHRRLAFVEEERGLVGEVEAEGVGHGLHVRVPEAGNKGEVRALAQVCNEFAGECWKR